MRCMVLVQRVLSTAPLLIAIACGGTTSSSPTELQGGDASTDSSADASADSSPSSDGGSCHAFTEHRAQATTCTKHDADGGVIDGGPSTCGQPITPHDACLVDSDCGSTGVCVCLSPGGMGCGTGVITGNECVPSNCRIDADCGACGDCRAETGCGMTTGFYCATPNDECGKDDDCRGNGQVGTACRFSNGKWSCVQGFGCAG